MAEPLEEAIEAARLRLNEHFHGGQPGYVAAGHDGPGDDCCWCQESAEEAVGAAAPIVAAQAERDALGGAAVELRTLAAQLGIGWDLERDPTPTYVAYGQAFKEAARRINEVGERLRKRAEETDA